jgi:uncharacterized protein YndB with AHSA1/START domain
MKFSDTLVVSTPSDIEIVTTRQLDAPRSLVFEAWTNPKYVSRWMLGPPGWTMPVCEIDLRVGGQWHFVWRKTDGTEMDMRGTYREITPPSRLVSTENWGGDWAETLNTLVLTEKNGITTAQLTLLYPSQEARDKAMATGVKQGMAMSFDRLEEFLPAVAG